jgi:hypothetical protein
MRGRWIALHARKRHSEQQKRCQGCRRVNGREQCSHIELVITCGLYHVIAPLSSTALQFPSFLSNDAMTVVDYSC